jgi:hypothetical protein
MLDDDVNDGRASRLLSWGVLVAVALAVLVIVAILLGR